MQSDWFNLIGFLNKHKIKTVDKLYIVVLRIYIIDYVFFLLLHITKKYVNYFNFKKVAYNIFIIKYTFYNLKNLKNLFKFKKLNYLNCLAHHCHEPSYVKWCVKKELPSIAFFDILAQIARNQQRTRYEIINFFKMIIYACNSRLKMLKIVTSLLHVMENSICFNVPRKFISSYKLPATAYRWRISEFCARKNLEKMDIWDHFYVYDFHRKLRCGNCH